MYSDRDYYRPSGFGGFSFFPPVIKNLLIINAAVFLVTNLLLANINLDRMPAELIITKYFALLPIKGIILAVSSLGEPIFGTFYPWQLITYQFMHANFSHILFNMFALWMFGMEIENLWGSKKFLLYYLACGIGGALLQLLMGYFVTGPTAPTVGASGAIYGVMIAFAMMFPDRYIYIYFLIPVKAKYLIAFLVVLEFFSAGDMSMVAHLVHLGGAFTGFVYIMYDRRGTLRLGNILNNFRKAPSSGSSQPQFRRRPSFSGSSVEDAEFYDLNKKKEETEITQEEIDRILDKISQSGYQNLTEREKKILFEASKKS